MGRLLYELDLILNNQIEDNQLFAFVTYSYQTPNSRTVVFVCDVD